MSLKVELKPGERLIVGDSSSPTATSARGC